MSKLIDNRTSPNGEPVFSTFLHSKGKAMGIPISGTFELTPRCNFNCKMCYIHSPDFVPENEISAEKWIALGEKARDAGVVFLLLTGGEPLIRKDFPYIYKELNKLGFIMSVNTNASLIDDELIGLFREYTPHRMNISLYGASEETYKSLCGTEKFKTVVENIEKLKNAGVQIKLNCSVTPYNCGDMEEIYALSEKLGLNIKMATYMYPPLRSGFGSAGVNSGRFSACEGAFYKVKYDILRHSKQEFLRRAEEAKNGILLRESDCIEENDEGDGINCRAGITTFWVDWRGNMSPCGMLPAGEYNVFEKEFSDCWQGVREQAKAIRLPHECRSCKYKNICTVCAAACLCETGAYGKKPEYVCEYIGKFAEIMQNEAERLKGE